MKKPLAEGPRKFKLYPAHRESNIDWLGRIPANWSVRRIKHLARLRSGHTPSRQQAEYWENCTIPWFGLADVWQIRKDRQDYVVETEEKISELGLANSAARLLPKGTVILSRTASVGYSAIMGTDMATTQDFVNWVCGKEILPEYLLYVFRSMRHELERLTMGSTHQTIYMPDAGRFCMPVPSLPEQNFIVQFIRQETSKLDALVAKKARLIELLTEERAAVITRAVTKGLDPNVVVRDSDVEWLGKIPSYWSVKRLWHLSPDDRRIMYGIVLPGPHIEDGIPIVKGGDVSPERLKLNRLNRTAHEIEASYSRSRLRGGDLVYAIRGSIGEVEMVPEELEGANLTQDAARIAYRDVTHGRWLLYALRSGRVFSQLESGALGATIRGINIRDLKRALLPVPPPEEQISIAAHLDRETRRIDGVLKELTRGIAVLTELRVSLISAAVTGKIDVRGQVS